MPGLGTLILIVLICVLIPVGGAFAYWVTRTSGTVPATRADVLPQGATPSTPTTSAPNGNTVVLSFAQVDTTDGTAITEYTVKRYAVGHSTPSESFKCSTAASPVTCEDASVPNGRWQYTDTPLFATNWVGIESHKSPTVVVVSSAPLLTITASSGTMDYGGTVPAITPSYSGFVDGQSASNLTTQPTCSTTATSSSSVAGSPYPSNCTGAVDLNYSFSYVPGSVTVTASPVIVTVSGSQRVGSSSPVFTDSNDAPSGISVTGTVTCTTVGTDTAIDPALAVGNYTILGTSCSGASLSGTDSTDYTISYVGATDGFTVYPVTSSTPPHGYWLVGSDGGIFTFGAAVFHGSTGNLKLNRPVVGITPTSDEGGYWLVASDGGIFSFGDTVFHGSIPGLGLLPAGSTGPGRHLNAPVVGMVPSADGKGYFLVASDGGVFAFGDAQFEGSCPGIGGCSGPAVAVMPDASGKGYWVVTATGHVYSFGDASYHGGPGPQFVPVTSAVRTPDGKGYWILFSNGVVATYGDANYYGSPAGDTGGSNPATAIFATADGDGYWVATANGTVYNYGDAPNYGGMSGTHLNGSIIAATGF
jgi:hypothetical protein